MCRVSCSCWEQKSMLGTWDSILHSDVTSSCCFELLYFGPHSWTTITIPPFFSFDFTARISVATIWQFQVVCVLIDKTSLESSFWTSGHATHLKWLPPLRALAGSQLILFFLIVLTCHHIVNNSGCFTYGSIISFIFRDKMNSIACIYHIIIVYSSLEGLIWLPSKVTWTFLFLSPQGRYQCLHVHCIHYFIISI